MKASMLAFLAAKSVFGLVLGLLKLAALVYILLRVNNYVHLW